MNKFRFASMVFILCVFALAFATVAHAQTAQRTFVSAQRGNDANTASLCSVANPCRGFNAAISVATAGGEVVALDSGGYGAVTINKAVTITGPTGVYVAITVATGDAITVAAGATDVVAIKGLTLKGLGSSSSAGIRFSSGLALHVEGCTISGFNDFGIHGHSNTSNNRLLVKDTLVRESYIGVALDTGFLHMTNTSTLNNQVYGVYVFFSVGGETAMIDDCHMSRNGTGLFASNGVKVTVRDSVASNNNFAGFSANGTGTNLNIENCTAVLNGQYGVITDSGARTLLSGSFITNNNVGVRNADGTGATTFTFGNNRIRGNAADKQGTLITAALE